jgi:ABC-type iron transport system FetAB permease component
MDAPGGERTQDLTWENVGLAFSFILFDAAVSKIFGLGVGTSLVTAAVRCVVQLTLVALILQKVFDTSSPWGVAGIACASCPMIHHFGPLTAYCS